MNKNTKVNTAHFTTTLDVKVNKNIFNIQVFVKCLLIKA